MKIKMIAEFFLTGNIFLTPKWILTHTCDHITLKN